ncbi:MAG: carboxypeptidase-like regulatory domain-containing protein [Bacteroidia bacterium]
MNKRETNQLNMYEAVEQVLNTSANSAIWTPNGAMDNAVATFMSHLGSIHDSGAAQRTSTVGTTVTKESLHLAMANAALKAANAGRAYATTINDEVLFDAMNYAKREILNATDTGAGEICQNIYDNLDPHIANTGAYGATATSQTDLQNLIDSYNGMIGKPALQRSISVVATLTLKQHFAAENGLLKNLLDPLMAQYETTNLAFYEQYKVARVIHDIGHRHTVIFKGFIYDASETALLGALIELTGAHGKRKKITDATGKYVFARLHTGTYLITVSKAGYVTQTKTITVSANGTFENDFILI